MGRKRKHRSSSCRIEVKKSNLTGSIEYCACIVLTGRISISEKGMYETKGSTIPEKIAHIVDNHLKRKIGEDYKFPKDPIQWRPTDSDGSYLLSVVAATLAEKETKEKEDNMEFIGEIIPDTGISKKVALFTFAKISEAWRTQREIWGSWKEFIRVYIEDEGDTFDVEEGDAPGMLICEELSLRKCLLRKFPDDSEKLGFKKIEKEEPTT